MTENNNSPIHKLRTAPGAIFHEYPRQFWILVGSAFIDRLGGAMLFPFFTLYMTKKFGISMTMVGAIFFLFAFSSFAGSMVGGALTDRLGRKGMLLFGLVMSALSALLMGLTNQIGYFVLVAVVVGTLADTGGPAQQALVADLLPENKRAEGYGIIRVVFPGSHHCPGCCGIADREILYANLYRGCGHQPDLSRHRLFLPA